MVVVSRMYDPHTPTFTGAEDVGFSPTSKTLLAPSAKRREVFGESGVTVGKPWQNKAGKKNGRQGSEGTRPTTVVVGETCPRHSSQCTRSANSCGCFEIDRTECMSVSSRLSWLKALLLVVFHVCLVFFVSLPHSGERATAILPPPSTKYDNKEEGGFPSFPTGVSLSCLLRSCFSLSFYFPVTFPSHRFSRKQGGDVKRHERRNHEHVAQGH